MLVQLLRCFDSVDKGRWRGTDACAEVMCLKAFRFGGRCLRGALALHGRFHLVRGWLIVSMVDKIALASLFSRQRVGVMAVGDATQHLGFAA